MDTLLLFDGTNLLHRSHHALATTDLRDEDGNPVWAVHGLLLSIFSFAKKFHADNIVVTFDTPGGSTSRKSLHPLYKANRGESNTGINYQLSLAYVILSELGVSTIAMKGEEADDLLASLANLGYQKYKQIVVVSNDRDCFQLINDKTKVLKTNSDLVDNIYIKNKYGINADQYKIFASLRGEPGDNIQGIKGIGEVKAKKLINAIDDWSNLEESRDILIDILGIKLATSVLAQQELLKLNLKLVELKKDLPVQDALSIAKRPLDRDRIAETLQKHNLIQVKKVILDKYF